MHNIILNRPSVKKNKPPRVQNCFFFQQRLYFLRATLRVVSVGSTLFYYFFIVNKFNERKHFFIRLYINCLYYIIMNTEQTRISLTINILYDSLINSFFTYYINTKTLRLVTFKICLRIVFFP